MTSLHAFPYKYNMPVGVLIMCSLSLPFADII